MLPIFRIISVGGVSLAISILALALIPPGGTHLLLTPHETVARGAMMDPRQHPEWRQFMIQAALRRADELERLRSLPGDPLPLPEVTMPARNGTANATPPEVDQVVAGLQKLVQPDDAVETTGSIGDNPGATIPIDIGEASSTELPIGPVEEQPPVSAVRDSRVPDPETSLPSTVPTVEMRDTVLPPVKPRARAVQRRPRHRTAPAVAEAAVSQVPPPFNFFAALFASLSQAQPAAPSNNPAGKIARPPNYKQASGNRAVTR